MVIGRVGYNTATTIHLFFLNLTFLKYEYILKFVKYLTFIHIISMVNVGRTKL